MVKSTTISTWSLFEDDLIEMLADGRNGELAARILANNYKSWKVIKDPIMPTRKVVSIKNEIYYIRSKTKKGFDLAPAKMKGTGRIRDEQTAKRYAASNNFLLIDATNGIIRHRLIKSPKVTVIKDISDPI